MYAIYGNIYHEYTPNVSIYTSTMDPMGYSVASSSVGFWPLAIYFSMAWGLPDVRLDANEATARCEAWAGGAPFERMAEDPKKHGGFVWKHGGSSSINIRRKFRSQTSDNMDRWKAEQGRGREKRKIRRKKSRRERVRRKKMQMREKVGKSRNTVFFQCFVAPEGQKVGSLKRRVRSQLARWEMKNCTPLWREAHFQVKMYKTHHCRTTFGSWDIEKCTPLWREAHFQVKMYKTHQLQTTVGSWDVEKVHAVVARSTFRSQNVQNTSVSDHFGSWDVEKVHAVVARSTFRSQHVKSTRGSDNFWRSARRCGAKDISK